jgi:hypothetical protein
VCGVVSVVFRLNEQPINATGSTLHRLNLLKDAKIYTPTPTQCRLMIFAHQTAVSKVCSACADPACAAVSPQSVSVQPRVAKGEAPPVWSQGALEAEKPLVEEETPVDARPQGTLTVGASRWPPSPSPWPFPVLIPPESLGWKAASSASPLARPQGAGVQHKRQEMQQQHSLQVKAAEPQEAFIEPSWQCATPGCELPDFHEGACTSQQVVGPRQRRPSVRKLGSTDDAAVGPATGASQKRKLAPPSTTSGETKGSARAAGEEVSPEVEGPSVALLRVWPPLPELSASGRLALAAIARAQDKWSPRAATAAQRGGRAAASGGWFEAPEASRLQPPALAPAPVPVPAPARLSKWYGMPAAPAPAPGWKSQRLEQQAASEAPSSVCPPDLGSAEFQLLQVLRPLHGNSVPGEQILHITDPQGNCFATTVPANVAPGAPFHVRVPVTNRAPRLAAPPR